MSLQIVLDPSVRSHRISPYLYGQFAEHLGRCIYNGIWVGEDSSIPNTEGFRQDTLDLLKALELPVLRWPGGCFADNYHWQDGIGPRNERPRRYNLNWSQPEPNTFGTHEFLRFCELIGTEPYICLNVGSGSVEEARSWVEYCCASQDTELTRMRARNGRETPFSVPYWGIGNENWGCGGSMRPDYYAHLYRQYASYVVRTAQKGAKLIACGSHPGNPEWDEIFLQTLKGEEFLVHYLALHHYANHGWPTTSTGFHDENYPRLMDVIHHYERQIKHALDLTRSYSTRSHRIDVILDEWGTWFADATVEGGLYQQNTMQDALFAAAGFHLFHRVGEGLFMTNLAQTVNVLQALVLTKGPQAIATPTYHVFDLFKPHRGGHLIQSHTVNAPSLAGSAFETPALSASATVNDDGSEMTVSLLNLHLSRDLPASFDIRDSGAWRIASCRQLAADRLQAHNTFEEPQNVAPKELAGASVSLNALPLPSKSITVLQLTRQ